MEFPFVVNTSEEGSSILMNAAPTMVIPYVTWLGTASVLGTFGNLLIIGTLLCARKQPIMQCVCCTPEGTSKQRPTGDVFILNLACSDLIVTAIINPFAIVGVTVGGDFFESRPALCEVLASVCVISCIASLLSIGCISVNRYIYICRQSSYSKIFTPTYSALMCAAVWVAATLFDLPSLIGWSQKSFDGKSHKCLWDRRKSHSYTLFLVLGGMGAPLVIIIIFYTCIFIHMSHAKAKLAHYTTQHSQCHYLFLQLLQQARMMLVIFVAFSLCWLPYISVLALDRDDSFPLWVHLYSSLVAHTHASLNFAIYGVANRKIRRSYVHFLKTKVFCCCVSKDVQAQDHVEEHHFAIMSPSHSEFTSMAGCDQKGQTSNGTFMESKGRSLRLLLSRHHQDSIKLREPAQPNKPRNDEDVATDTLL